MTDTPTPPRSFAALDITLPLLITGLLVLMIGVFAWGAYVQVRHVTLGAAAAHLESATAQLAASLRSGVSQRTAEAGGNGRRAGYVVNWRRVQASRDATRRLTELIGSDAALLVGNATGDVWTDLSARVRGPPVDVRDRPGVIEYTRPGRGTSLARAQVITGTPWVLV